MSTKCIRLPDNENPEVYDFCITETHYTLARPEQIPFFDTDSKISSLAKIHKDYVGPYLRNFNKPLMKLVAIYDEAEYYE
jgi:hypothetical protein